MDETSYLYLFSLIQEVRASEAIDNINFLLIWISVTHPLHNIWFSLTAIQRDGPSSFLSSVN